jgi:hypothetical protein
MSWSVTDRFVWRSGALLALYASRFEIFHSRTIIVIHPTPEQCVSRETPAIVSQVLQSSKDLPIFYMLNKGPADASKEEIRKWYNTPLSPDFDPSNYERRSTRGY